MATEASGVNVKEVTERADQLYRENKWRKAYEYLNQYKDIDDAGVQWRLARLCYLVSEHHADSQEEAKQIAQEGLIHAERSIQLDNSSPQAFRVRDSLTKSTTDIE